MVQTERITNVLTDKKDNLTLFPLTKMKLKSYRIIQNKYISQMS